jgi:hypothetical protein
MGTWIGYKDYTDHQKTEANLKAQYGKLAGVEIQVTDTARHFIMWDDPAWMFETHGSLLADCPMRNRILYCCWQAAFWGTYTGVLCRQTIRSTGWQPHIVFDYLLFFGYFVALTDLLRREILRRGWLDAVSFRTAVWHCYPR